jgi:hypothetical protein
MAIKIRWIVTHLPWEKQKALAIKRGWDEKDGSCWDWIEPEECEQEFGPYPNLQKALEKAKTLVALDTLGEPRIERQEYLPDDAYDDELSYRWVTACGWIVHHDTEKLDEDSPDVLYSSC